MNDQTEFTPKQIGRFNEKQFSQVREYYDDLCADLTMCYHQLCGLFPEFSINEFFEYIKTPNPERWILNSYAKTKEPEYPDMNVPAMISAGLLKLPTDYTESLQDYDKINRTLRLIKDIGFFFPLSELFQQTETEKYFGLTEKFREALETTLTPITKSMAQNEALEALECIQCGLNTLHEMKVINFATHGLSFLGTIGQFYVLDKHNKDCPVDIDRNVFIKTKLRRFLIKQNTQQKHKQEQNLWQ